MKSYNSFDTCDGESCDETTQITGNTRNGKKDPKWWSRIPKRYVVAVMSFFGFFNVYALRVNLSIAIVDMVANKTTVSENGTISYHQDYDWDSGAQGILLSAFFWGYIVTQIPGGLLASKFGAKKFFGCGILSTAIFTLMTPFTAKYGGFSVLVMLRIVEGLCEGVTYPAMYALWRKWAPPLERSRLVSIALSGSYVGTLVAMPLSGLLAEYAGWQSIFYVFGTIGVIWFVTWSWLISETPESHKTISNAELEYISQSAGTQVKEIELMKVPWRQILTSGPVWAIIIAHFSDNWGSYTLLTELPSFLNDALNFKISKTGILSAVPYLLMAIVVQISGQMADFLRRRSYMSTTRVRKVFNSCAFIGQMIFLTSVAFTIDDSTSVVVCVTLAVGIGGLSTSGFFVNHLDVAPQYAGLLMGVSNSVGTIAGILSPVITGQIVKNKTAEEWQIVFLISAGIYAFGGIIFAVLSSGEPQSWADSKLAYDGCESN